MTDKQHYILGYGEGAMRWMTSRTADEHGAFLLPYLKPGMRLLDSGCGPGTLTLGFARQIAPGEAIGIDRESSQFAEVTKAAAHEGIAGLQLVAGDIFALPYPAASFDVVFASAVLGSVAEPEKVVAEMSRVLKPGGVLALKEFDHEGDIIWPQSPLIRRSTELYHRLREHNHHAPHAGRRLRGFLQAADCRVDYLHAFYDQKVTPDELRAHIDRNNYLINEMLGPQYIQNNWCAQQDIDDQAAEWIRFAADPAAVYLASWFEAIGIKR